MEEVPACDDQGLGVAQSSALGTVSMERGRLGKAGAGGALAGAWAVSKVGPAVRPRTWVWPRSAPGASAGGSPPSSRLSPQGGWQSSGLTLPPAAPLAPRPPTRWPAFLLFPLNKTGRSRYGSRTSGPVTQPCDSGQGHPGPRSSEPRLLQRLPGWPAEGFGQRSRRGRPCLSWRNCKN